MCVFVQCVRSVYVRMYVPPCPPTARGPEGYNPADEFECQVCVCMCVCVCVCVELKDVCLLEFCVPSPTPFGS